VKPGIVIITEIGGELGDRILAEQRRFDPRMAAELPPHITITGSSGMGPIPAGTPIDVLRQALEPIGGEMPPFTVRLQPPHRFMQSNVVVFQIDPNGPIRALHDRIKRSGLPFEQPRFTFTPHVTLSFYPELSRDRLRDALGVRIDDEVPVDRFSVFRTETLTRTQKLFDVELRGPSERSS
jgi:2'-5' RNA ligase